MNGNLKLMNHSVVVIQGLREIEKLNFLSFFGHFCYKFYPINCRLLFNFSRLSMSLGPLVQPTANTISIFPCFFFLILFQHKIVVDVLFYKCLVVSRS